MDTHSSRQTLIGIQYLRGLAALMVVAHHARHFFPEANGWTDFGARGVDIFFVISGFIMAYVSQSYDADANKATQAGEFLLKRAIRIIPLYWLALALAARHLIVGGDINVDLIKDFLFTPHFREGTQNIFPYLTPGWTINYEIFFYLLFGLCMFFGRFRYHLLIGTFMALIAFGLVADTSTASAPVLFYTSFILHEFLLGILLCFAVTAKPMRVYWLASTAAILVGLLALYYNPTFNFWFLNGLASLCVVWGFLTLFETDKDNLPKKVGDASYSIYLFHVLLLPYGKKALAWIGIAEPTALNILAVIAFQLVFVTIVCLLLYRLIEQPMLKIAQHLLLPKKRT